MGGRRSDVALCRSPADISCQFTGAETLLPRGSDLVLRLRYGSYQNAISASKPFSGITSAGAMGFVISRQRRKLAQKIDTYAAWADAEYRILERFRRRVTAAWRNPRPAHEAPLEGSL